jgi:hypothetical protein
VGLITGLLTLPLAPVRGTAWLAQCLQEQAEGELYDESAIRTGLIELEEARANGAFGEEEIAEAEDVLLERLMWLRGLQAEETHGEGQ